MATVIKAGRVIPSGTTVQHAEYNLEDVSQTAAHYLDTVKQQAAQIVREAQLQARKVLQQAEQQGRQAAETAAQKAALAEIETRWLTLAPALSQAINATAQLRTAWLKQWEQNMVRVVVAVAERVIRGELSRQPHISQQWIREALELASGANTITLQLNPDDFAALGEKSERIREQFGQLAPTSIVAEPSISASGCRVLTDYGHIDQQVASQLARIEEELTT
jgi:flagellar assembly protein FliH